MSIVIVNYNVRYFLEQCLHSVRLATARLSAEVFVVDNASADDSLAMLERFAEVRVIANAENLGFAKANNLAIRRARGRYILLLNPDTLVDERALERALAYAEAHPRVGCIGARMLDGRGRFLPESKRGFPTAWVSFTKMTGLGRAFPRSSRFNGYYLGHLSDDEPQRVDVLPGAFMWLRREALDAVGGGLDEDYFMYGEDVDLSYCLQRAGYENAYLPEVEIVHYKGESTRKRSWGYVRTFYRAMAIFSRKHVAGAASGPRRWALDLAIYGRAGLSLALNALSAIAVVLLDAALLAATLLGVKALWATMYFGAPDYYPATFEAINLPLDVGLWVSGLALAGAYERPLRLPAVAKGLALGTALVLIAYALLPTELRTSRAIVVIGWGVGTLALTLVRVAWGMLRPSEVSFAMANRGARRRLAIVAGPAEANRTLQLLARAGVAREYVGRIAPDVPSDTENDDDTDALGVLAELPTLSDALALDEVILSLGALPVSRVTAAMRAVGDRVEVRTLAPGAEAIVGSPSPASPGQPYAVAPVYDLGSARHRRRKRTTDVLVALGILLAFPLVLLCERPLGALRNALVVLLGGATWVGYGPGEIGARTLPRLAPAVLPLVTAAHNVAYARSYRPSLDVRRVLREWRSLGGRPVAIEEYAPARWPARTLAVRVRVDPARG